MEQDTEAEIESVTTPSDFIVLSQPLVDLTLIPYGIAKLRITECPVLAECGEGLGSYANGQWIMDN
jgi:hypothetical protein